MALITVFKKHKTMLNKLLFLIGSALPLAVTAMSKNTRALRTGTFLSQTIKRSTVFRTANQVILHDGSNFHVFQNGERNKVKHYDLDPMLCGIKTAQLRAFKKCGYVRANKAGNDYILRAYPRGNGGFVGAAAQAYWITKIGLYSLLGLSVSAVAALSGGMTIAAGTSIATGTATTGTVTLGVGSAVVNATIATIAAPSATAAFLATTAGSVAGVVGGAETGLAAGAAALGTSAVASVSATAGTTTASAGLCACTAALIESAASAVSLFFLACPWTPW